MLGHHEVISDLLALRLITQRLYARLALATRKDNAWLDAEREAILETLKSQNVAIRGEPAKVSEQIKKRAEFTINLVFDSVRIDRR
jgi:hypothetical protein